MSRTSTRLTEDEHKLLIKYIEKFGLNFAKLSAILKHSADTLETHFYSYISNNLLFSKAEKKILLELTNIYKGEWNLITEKFNLYFFQTNNHIKLKSDTDNDNQLNSHLNALGYNRTKNDLIIEFYQLMRSFNK
ncbi:hypothetical protein CDIK_3121 [Cucumispora dikerogammari]|nr:hypothetical protein CDIK_3121 [Cucumispora dikerogammari]